MELGAAGEVPLHQGGHDDWSGHLYSCILLSSDDTPICIAIDAMRMLYTEIQASSRSVDIFPHPSVDWPESFSGCGKIAFISLCSMEPAYNEAEYHPARIGITGSFSNAPFQIIISMSSSSTTAAATTSSSFSTLPSPFTAPFSSTFDPQ